MGSGFALRRSSIGMGLAISFLFLGGCGSQENLVDLKQYVAELESKYKGHVEPLPQIKPRESFAYGATMMRDPFQPPAQAEPEEEVAQPAGNGIHPDFSRPKEPLEQFPLDTLRMVGTLEQEKVVWALITGVDGTIYRVHAGNHMGQNHGKIIGITQARVELTEIIPDGKGGWQEQPAAIDISEASMGGKQ